MVKGIALSDAMLDVGHQHGTTNAQLVKGLGRFVWTHYSKFVPLKKWKWSAEMCSDYQVLLLEVNETKHKHFVVFNADEQKIYDPGWPEPMDVASYIALLKMNNWRVKSYLPVKSQEDIEQENNVR